MCRLKFAALYSMFFCGLLLFAGCAGKQKTLDAASPESSADTSAAQTNGSVPPPETFGPPELFGPSLPPGAPIAPSMSLSQIITPIQADENDYAIVLGPGGVRAFAHVGVLRELEDREIKFRAVYGLELGAFIGALYGNSNANKVEWEIYKFEKNNFLDKGFLGYSSKSKQGKSYEKFVEKIFKDKSLESFKTPVFVSFLDNNVLKVSNRGSAKTLLRASASMTGLLDSIGLRVDDAVEYARVRETFKGKMLCIDVSGGDGESVKMWAEAGKNCDQTIVVDTSGTDSLNFAAKADLIFKGRAAVQKWFEEGHLLQ